ncbi:glycoside hydrolase TIM-barrel-like domain-containing protein [Paracoccus sp. Z330]|uniref:Glycoside hydrolase TIM-barrel-like domain-containing protein n=1 Tax=Paracoccus onchidii TaxID=3017813 RepID=A0ABT4ZFB5_9RHOB|nr:glycoside hydrolase TIM-barrel-like domain-containing protein [Paracoccus onchidii]MDB6178038.1 glycoside hydrolase TIM-barrel-like domain-containing protein [Paracoccus onchidii]
MATIVLSAVGASIGGSMGGAVLGLSGAVIGRAVGATVGRAIDQRLLGGGSRAVETGRIDRLRLQSAGEGVPIPRIWGQMRLPGHVIWASPLEETQTTEGGGGGKGAPSQPSVTQIGYRLSVAISLCEGPVLGVGRVWADGEEIAAEDLNLRIYCGDADQMPDPAIVAHEGENTPAYRGLAYVVLEDLGLERWGNRMPQLSFEVTCPARDGTGLHRDVRAVALIPGTGEYSLATTQVTQDLDLGETKTINVNTPMGGTDFSASMNVMGRELPNVGSVALVVSWFGDDLRINNCALKPKVEQSRVDGSEMAWHAGGLTRSSAQEVATIDDRPIYGGTPSDQSIVEALQALDERGQRAVFYPFILMEQLQGNGLPNPYGGTEQPVMPWRGRITCSVAAGRNGSVDGTEQAVAEVATFFGSAEVADFTRRDAHVEYHGPAEWSYRRFILHYAHLCAAAGGIDAFLIGSEMIGMTQIRGPQNSYPAVAQLRRLARDVRAVLGPDVKIGYAADWSEYFGHHPGDGELFFHLDPLWADENIDFIGIDNYMPLSDWRDGEDHLDAHWGDVRNVDYLKKNVCGGEGFDWFYASESDRNEQRRTPISDGQYDEAWVWKYKDLKSWWQNLHFNRPGGVRSREATGWVPGSKPIWFTEYGCAALDKATNQPNKFLDAYSSESVLPYFSTGQRDDAVQSAYVAAVNGYWSDPDNNPEMEDGGRMVDLSRAHVWCWDARPYPAFPARRDLWSDGPAWERGHWLNGRAGAVMLPAVVGDICRSAGVTSFDTSRIHGVVRGYTVAGGDSGRAALQSLMLVHGFDAVDGDGALRFVPRKGLATGELSVSDMAVTAEVPGFETVRAAEPELVGRLRLTHVEAGADYGAATTETNLPENDQETVSDSEFTMSLTRAEGRAIAERWLSESTVSRDTARFALPPSMSDLGVGDVLRIDDGTTQPRLWRLDRIERAGALTVDAVRVEPGVYRPALSNEDDTSIRRYVPPMPVWPIFLDLPLLKGNEDPHAPYLAATARPWPGSVAAYMSVEEEGGYDFSLRLDRASVIGRTENGLVSARSSVLDRGAPLRVRLKGHSLRSVSDKSLLAGANAMAIGDGSLDNWEIFQFRSAVPVGNDLWDLSERLRGQAGTDGNMPDIWPEGSVVVLLNNAVKQVPIAPSTRGQERFWRVGPALRAPDDASYRSRRTIARGIGLRPYAPCQLRVQGRSISWVRRTRIDGDGWDGLDVPLGETREIYLLRVIRQGQVLAEVQVTAPAYQIPNDLWQSTLSGGAFEIAVAQLSDQFGAGPFARRTFHAYE